MTITDAIIAGILATAIGLVIEKILERAAIDLHVRAHHFTIGVLSNLIMKAIHAPS